MEIEELRELFSDMLSKDLRPMLCDSQVPKYDTYVPCGSPTMCYEDISETISLPKELLSMHPEFVIPVKGESMIDAGIETGDMVKVLCGQSPMDGDIVLACIDGEYTLKTYCEYEDGEIWLVPQNEEYQPILLNDQYDVRIIGCVKEIMKKAPRMAYRQCAKIIKRAKQTMVKKQEISREKIDWVLKEIAEKVMLGRQWYAVYRPFADKGIVEEGDYITFCGMVRAAVPNHEHLPAADELQRMAVQSFKKPVRQWNPKDAPVGGKRFLDYKSIGLETLEMLESGD